MGKTDEREGAVMVAQFSGNVPMPTADQQTGRQRIHPDTIEEVKQQVDILNVIGEHIALRKRGKDFIGLCPFHDEKTPSFSVSPAKQMYYCFGCGAGGNAINFLMDLGKRSFRQVVLDLAAQYGVQAKDEDGNFMGDYHALPYPVSHKRQSVNAESEKPKKDYTVDARYVERSKERLLNHQGEPQQKALEWLLNHRGFTSEMIEHFPLGLERISANANPDEQQLPIWKHYWGVGIFIPVPSQPGRFYRKVRVAPWLNPAERPDYLRPWYQMGVPTTVWVSYLPENATATYFTEGEWDAMRLGWEARQRGEKVAIACSTGGCGTLPKLEQLEVLPGEITIFYDRNDNPDKNGLRPGDEGAKKLALTLSGRGKIGEIPMASDCDVKGWDVSNALDVAFTWEDFEAAAAVAAATPTPVTEDGGDETAAGNGGGRWGRGFGGSGSNGGDSGDGNTPRPKAVSLRDRIIEILQRESSQFLRDAALMDLADSVGRSFSQINQLAKVIQVELEFGADMVEAATKFQDLIKTRRTKLDVERYLEKCLANAIIQTAQNMPTDPAFLFNVLLPVAMSRVGTAGRVVVDAASNYTQPLIFFTVNVSDSGTAKTAVQRAITQPLYDLQAEAYDEFFRVTADYQAELERRKGLKGEDAAGLEPLGPVPVCKRYIIEDATLEAKQEVHAQNPRGLYEDLDEFAAKENRQNQYRGGIGADKQAELKQWDGATLMRDRVGKFVFLAKSAISRGGSIQWDVLALQMADHQDFDGNWARNLFCAAKAPLRYLNLFGDKTDPGLSQILRRLYQTLELVPEQDYFLTNEAKLYFQTWQHELMNAMREEISFGMKLVFPKIEAYTVRLAGALHIINAGLRAEMPRPMIDGETMQRAVELAAYYLGQARIVHSHNNPASGLDGVLAKIQGFAEEVGKTITASMCLQRFTSLRKYGVDRIRELFKTLSKAGFGTVFGGGNKLAYQAGVGGPSSELLVAPPMDETSILQGIESTVCEIGEASRSQPQIQKNESELHFDLVADDFVTQREYQFTNTEAELLDNTSLEAIGKVTNTSPTTSPTTFNHNHDFDQDDTSLGGEGSVRPVNSEQNAPSKGCDELLSDNELNEWSDRMNACQMLPDVMEFYMALDSLPLQQRKQFELSVPQDRWKWLLNLPESVPTLPESELAFAVLEPKSESKLSLEELKALMLACDSLVQFNELKRIHNKTIAQAYCSMTESQQAYIDAIRALTVPHKVFKYLGEEIKQETQRLIKGTLVYLDPALQVRASTYSALVWAINGISSGWKQPVEVSLSLLQEVVKAVLPSQNQDSGQQMGLI